MESDSHGTGVLQEQLPCFVTSVLTVYCEVIWLTCRNMLPNFFADLNYLCSFYTLGNCCFLLTWLAVLHRFLVGTNLNFGLLVQAAQSSISSPDCLHLLAQQTEHWAPKEGTWGRWLMPGAGNPMHPKQLSLGASCRAEKPGGVQLLCGFDPTSSCVQSAFALRREQLGNWGLLPFYQKGEGMK